MLRLQQTMDDWAARERFYTINTTDRDPAQVADLIVQWQSTLTP